MKVIIIICHYLDVPTQDTELLLRLYNWFPGDVGCFCVFFLNFLHLKPGQALYLAPNEPHAYIFGGETYDTQSFSDCALNYDMNNSL